MIKYTQNAFSNPKIAKVFDWSVFAGGMASLVFAIAMTVGLFERLVEHLVWRV